MNANLNFSEDCTYVIDQSAKMLMIILSHSGMAYYFVLMYSKSSMMNMYLFDTKKQNNLLTYFFKRHP